MELCSREGLSELCQELLAIGAITYDRRQKQLERAALNPHDNSLVNSRLVNTIAELMYERTVEHHLEYDAVTSIPNGGNVYAEGLLRVIAERDGRQLPMIRLQKGTDYPERILDHAALQPGSRVLIVDDVLRYGANAVETLRILAGAQYRAGVALFVADFEWSGSECLSKQHACSVLSLINSSLMRSLYS